MFVEKLTDEQIIDITKKMLLASNIEKNIVNHLTDKKIYVTRFFNRIEIVAVCCDWCRYSLQLNDYHCLIGVYKRSDLDILYAKEMYKIFGKKYLICCKEELKKEWNKEIEKLQQKIKETNVIYNHKIKEIRDMANEEGLSK